jgi:hypothetical protein
MNRPFAMIITISFTFYGAWRFYRDYLSRPIRIAADYIDGMGAAFYVCLALAGLVVLAVSMGRRKPPL